MKYEYVIYTFIYLLIILFCIFLFLFLQFSFICEEPRYLITIKLSSTGKLYRQKRVLWNHEYYCEALKPLDDHWPRGYKSFKLSSTKHTISTAHKH